MSVPHSDLTTAQMIMRLRSSLQLTPLAVELISPGTSQRSTHKANPNKIRDYETETDFEYQIKSDTRCNDKTDPPIDCDLDTTATELDPVKIMIK